jgi:hypothetical protein
MPVTVLGLTIHKGAGSVEPGQAAGASRTSA